ncbi:MAG: ATP-binding SpoIIE family protein phosphatase, partial [Acidimicrobiales bacterium]
MTDGTQVAGRAARRLAAIFRHPRRRRSEGTPAPAVVAPGGPTTEGRRLQAEDQAARRDAEAARRRLDVLADLSQLLSSSLDPDVVVDRVQELVTDRLGDGCVVLVKGERGLRRYSSKRRAVGPGRPSFGPTGGSPDVGAPELPLDATSPEALAFRTATPQIATVTPTSPRPAGTVDDGTVGGVGGGSRGSTTLAVPLPARGSVIGVLSLVAGPDRSGFDPDDVSLAVEIGARAALALDNAQRYQRERGVAEALQRAVLPERLKEVPGLALDAEYRAGTAGILAGGDWYDTVELEDGCLYFSVGDVMGKGPQAAALMGQVRSAMRAYVVDYPSPATVLSGIDRLFDVLEERRLVSAIIGIVDPTTGETWLANAGHPPPLLIRRSGSIESVDGGRSMILGGGLGGAERVEHRLQMAPGDLLVCYTDGLIERRGEALGEGFDRLVETLGRSELRSDAGGGGAAALVDALLGGAPVDDDVALLTVRFRGSATRPLRAMAAHPSTLAPVDNRLPLPASTASTPAARRWIAERLADLPSELVDTAVLLTSELVTNAILHAGTGVVLSIHRGPDRVRVDVADGSPVEPTVKGYGSDATVGRGLTLFDRLASAWGTRPIIPRGKIVWFELPVDIPGEWGGLAGVPAELDEWPAVLGHPAGADVETSPTTTVRLLGVPTEALRDCLEHYDALHHELQLIVERGPDARLRPDGPLLATVDELVGRFGSLGLGGDRELHEALAQQAPVADLQLRLPGDVGSLCERSDRLLDEADAFCRSADLITLPATPEQVGLRKWFLEELARQAAGCPPVRWAESRWAGATAADGDGSAGGAGSV